MTPYEIPLSPKPQQFTITLGGVEYLLVVTWCEGGPCWVLDIRQPDNTLIIGSIPLVTGCDLIGQYEYLGISGSLEVQSDVDITLVPTFDTLGDSGHLYFLAD